MACEDIPSLLDLQNTKKRVDHFGRLIDGTETGTSTNPITGETLPTYKKAIEDLGFKPGSGDFNTGFTVLPGQYDIAWRNPGDNNWYSWAGVIPEEGKVVPPGSSPLTTGGLGPTGWRNRTDILLRDELIGDDGFAKVAFKPSTIADAVKRSLEDWLEDGLTVNVKWFGAKGNWDMGPAQTGDDDTVAIANATTFLATMGSRRVGAVRRLYFPQGAYRYDSIALQLGISFALQIIGDGRFATYLCANQANSLPAIDCAIESIDFKDLTLMGSLSDAVAGDPVQWKDIGFKGKNYFNTPDIDVKFTNCDLLFFKEVTNIYGRGVVFDNCGIGQINTLINIVCDPTTVFLPSPQALGSVETGMRHFTIRNCRTDQVRVSLITVTGTGPQKEYINNITVLSCDFVATEKLIDAPDATLRMLTVLGNSGLTSFRGGVISAKGAHSHIINNNNFARRYEATIAPTTFQDCIPYILNTAESMHNVQMHNNSARNLSGNTVACASTTPGSVSHISIKNNSFPNGWTYFESPSNICYIFFALVDCPFLSIEGNDFDSTVTSRTYRVFNPTVQTSKHTYIGANPAPWSWTDTRLSYLPLVYINGVAASVVPSGRSGRFYYDGTYCQGELMIVSSFTETTGPVEISCPPITAIAENSGITTSYSGYGIVTSHSGWVSASNSFSRCVVNPVTQRIQLFKEGGMVRTAVTAADKPAGAMTLYISFKYRA